MKTPEVPIGPQEPAKGRNRVPQALNTDFFRVCLFVAVESSLSIGALITATGSLSLPDMGKAWVAIFCSNMLTSISHASAINGRVTAGKVG